MSIAGRKARQFQYKALSVQIPTELWEKFEYVARKYKYKEPIPLLKDIMLENIEKWTQWGYFQEYEAEKKRQQEEEQEQNKLDS